VGAVTVEGRLGGEGRGVWPWVRWGWEEEGGWPAKGSVWPPLFMWGR
jgi:hypothetical protein